MAELLHRRSDSYYNKKINLKKKQEPVQNELVSLNSLIKPKQRKDIIKKIFKNNEQAFDDLILDLESITNWRDALMKVENTFNKLEIYLHHPDAVIFTNILYKRYFPDDH